MENLKTGDLLLFNNRVLTYNNIFGTLTKIINWGTHSNYSHIAMILKDPTFLHPNLRGTYVWESSWEGKPDPQDGKIKLGVQITPINEILDVYRINKSHAYVRKIECDKELFNDKNLAKIHKIVYEKPYDICPIDWIEGFLQKDPNPQKINKFWCSALVGYIYTKCGILKNNTDWSILTPNDFSIDGENLSYNDGAKLSFTEIKLF